MHPKPSVYFGACDRQMEAFLDRNAFRRGLVNGILFHGDLIIPDIYLYISSRLAEIIDSDPAGYSFLRTCIRNGVVVPAFRKDTKGSFRDNLEDIQLEGIQGIHSSAANIADKLQEAAYGKRLNYLIWPTKPFSVGYKATVERVFLANNIPSGAPQLERFWDVTKEFRLAVVGETGQDSFGGFRRGDLYNSVARYLAAGSTPVHDIRIVWEGLEDQQQADSVRRMLKWINYCYHYNHGRMFGLSPALASMDALDLEFARLLAQLDFAQDSAIIFQQTFQLPSVDALLTIDSDRVLDVRDSDVGADYFVSLLNWQQHPSEDSAHVLLDRLDRYTSKLRGLFIEHGRSVLNWEWYLRALIPCGRSRWKSIAMELGKEIAGNLIPGIGLMSLVGKLAAATYESLPSSVQGALGPLLGIGKRVRIEAEQKTVRVGEDRGFDMQRDATFE
jgi:hypothetical protein